MTSLVPAASTNPRVPPPPPPPPPVPTPPAEPPPQRAAINAQILADVDASLISCLALAYFGPAEQGTSQAVDVVCTSEVLLFRLRMARRAVADLREALDLPARQVPPIGARVDDDTVSAPGGLGPRPSVAPEKERTPRSAAVVLVGPTASESTRAVVADGAGADVPARRRPAGVAVASAAAGRNGEPGFANPNTRLPLRFAAGENRIYGPASQPEPPPNPGPLPPTPIPA